MALFDGKVAIVTGAGRGLGRDFARFFAQDGAAVVLADLDEENARQAAAEIAGTGARALGLRVDVTDPASTVQMAQRAQQEHGRIDFLVNNAGIWGDLVRSPLLDTDPAYWDSVMAVNVKGVWLGIRAVAPIMRAQRYGRIVNISSIGAWIPGGIYNITKLAVHGVSAGAAMQLGPDGITVNCVAPGGILNESTLRQTRGMSWEQARDAAPTASANDVPAGVTANPLGRWGNSRDMYGAIRWLCSDDAPWVTAQVISPNGGSHPRY